MNGFLPQPWHQTPSFPLPNSVLLAAFILASTLGCIFFKANFQPFTQHGNTSSFQGPALSVHHFLFPPEGKCMLAQEIPFWKAAIW